MKFLALAAAFVGLTTAASATTITVDARANGQFGVLYASGTPMIQGPALQAGDTINITATGQIGLGEQLFVDANGVDVSCASGKVFCWEYTPLEEAAVDATPSLANLPVMPSLGALIGAFIPQSTVDTFGFSARDTDFGGDIAATDLFFVGTSLSFTADVAGTLFFGVNEAYVANNSGAFTVNTQPATVPLPASGLMLLAGLGAAGFAARRKPRG